MPTNPKTKPKKLTLQQQLEVWRVEFDIRTEAVSKILKTHETGINLVVKRVGDDVKRSNDNFVALSEAIAGIHARLEKLEHPPEEPPPEPDKRCGTCGWADHRGHNGLFVVCKSPVPDSAASEDNNMKVTDGAVCECWQPIPPAKVETKVEDETEPCGCVCHSSSHPSYCIGCSGTGRVRKDKP